MCNKVRKHEEYEKTSNNTSGFTGVTFNKSKGKWQCQAQIDGKYKYLGLFDDLDQAISARKRFNIDNGFHENHGKTLKANA
ncbi:putative HNH endonuclease [Escherichia phage e4/1c]|uniref:Putative HNH endonuclease n=1 Tax=Escherichia phage e4/1c TaxID=1495286 RepID=A0A023ZUB0_9CAUD|nr:putative HNH endonuclease [Escherichia phage e4/1c]AHY83154.1 putative HNH endonuclease [Escherichia phage e4/1c]